MGDYNEIVSHDIVSVSIFHFLENLLAAVHTSETLATEASERDQINVPTEIKPGGYPEGIFIFLSEREKDQYLCNVCYSVIKDVHQCSNGHKYCYSCIYVWSTGNRVGADSCPVCRCEGVYARNDQLNEKIGGKRVKCQDEGCNWRGFLRDYTEHEHRHYEFKEISRSVELPHMKGPEATHTVQLPLPEINKRALERSQSHTETFPFPGSLPTIESSLVSYTTFNQTRASIAPRRLPRLSEYIPRSMTPNNPSETDREGLQTPPLSPQFEPPRERRTPLLPAINRSPSLDYRRLAPTYASRRHPLGFFNDNNEHLATILILLTTDVGERVPGQSSPGSSVTGSSRVSFNDRMSGQSRRIVYHSAPRSEERRNLWGPSEGARSIDVLLEATRGTRGGREEVSSGLGHSGGDGAETRFSSLGNVSEGIFSGIGERSGSLSSGVGDGGGEGMFGMGREDEGLLSSDSSGTSAMGVSSGTEGGRGDSVWHADDSDDTDE